MRWDSLYQRYRVQDITYYIRSSFTTNSTTVQALTRSYTHNQQYYSSTARYTDMCMFIHTSTMQWTNSRVVDSAICNVELVVVDTSEVMAVEVFNDQPTSSHVQQACHKQPSTLTLDGAEEERVIYSVTQACILCAHIQTISEVLLLNSLKN